MNEFLLTYIAIGLGFLLCVLPTEEGDRCNDGSVSGFLAVCTTISVWPVIATVNILNRGRRK